MATRYKFYAKNSDLPNWEQINSIQRILDDGTISSIPTDPSNTDYIEYLEWAKTNTTEAAD